MKILSTTSFTYIEVYVYEQKHPFISAKPYEKVEINLPVLYRKNSSVLNQNDIKQSAESV